MKLFSKTLYLMFRTFIPNKQRTNTSTAHKKENAIQDRPQQVEDQNQAFHRHGELQKISVKFVII